jgi:hypothetical protein
MPASAQANPFDHASRGLLRRASPALLWWLLKVSPSQAQFVRWLDTRLTVPGQPERVCDTIAHVLRVDQDFYPWAIPIEFQVAPDGRMFGRALVYEGMVWLGEKPAQERGDRFDLMPVIVNLTGVGQCGRRMLWQPGAESTLLPIEWNLETLDANFLLDQIVSGKAPRELLAWLSLMKNGNDPGTIKRWLEVASLERDPYRKADLALVEVFANLTGGTEVWEKALEGFNVIESVTVNKWKAQAVAKSLLGILEKKFSPVPAEVQTKIEATTALDVLQHWVILAATTDSMDSFRRGAGV